jgi:toxin YhaV
VTIINGWTLYAHPLFSDQLERLTTAVEKAKRKNPATYQSTANAKLLAQLHRLMFETIPVDPAKIIVYTWVNDSDTLRTYGSKSDAYAVFKAMLDKGNPPEDWAALLALSSEISGTIPAQDPPVRAS